VEKKYLYHTFNSVLHILEHKFDMTMFVTRHFIQPALLHIAGSCVDCHPKMHAPGSNSSLLQKKAVGTDI